METARDISDEIWAKDDNIEGVVIGVQSASDLMKERHKGLVIQTEDYWQTRYYLVHLTGGNYMEIRSILFYAESRADDPNNLYFLEVVYQDYTTKDGKHFQRFTPRNGSVPIFGRTDAKILSRPDTYRT